jgi:hypothetical protein
LALKSGEAIIDTGALDKAYDRLMLTNRKMRDYIKELLRQYGHPI